MLCTYEVEETRQDKITWCDVRSCCLVYPVSYFCYLANYSRPRARDCRVLPYVLPPMAGFLSYSSQYGLDSFKRNTEPYWVWKRARSFFLLTEIKSGFAESDGTPPNKTFREFLPGVVQKPWLVGIPKAIVKKVLIHRITKSNDLQVRSNDESI